MFRGSINRGKRFRSVYRGATLVALACAVFAAGVAQAAAAVVPQLTVSPPPAVVATGFPVTFTGTITPAHIGARVVLQRLARDGRWRRIAVGYDTGPGGAYAVTHIFRVASRGTPAELRIVVPRHVFGVRVASEPFPVTVERLRRHVHRGHPKREERRRHHRQVVEERRHHREQVREERRHHREQVREERRRRREERHKLHHHR